MPTRVEVEDIQAVLETSLTHQQISSFLADANLWVTTNLATDLNDANLRAVEKYLTCYFVTLRDPRLTRADFDDVKETYQRDAKVSEYLKAAMSYDPTGKVEAAFGDQSSKTRVRYRVGTGFTEEAVSARTVT